MNSDECPWHHGTLLMTVLELSWVHIAPWHQAHGFSWVLLMSTHEYPVDLMSTHKQPWEAMSVPDYHWTLMSSHKHSWAWRNRAMTNCESSRAVMSMAPWGSECSSALMSAHSTIAPYSRVLVGAHEHTWALMGTPEHSQQVMSAELFH